jgi:hypothetical protein
MNELELIRAQLLGIRAQADAAIAQVSALIEQSKASEEEKPVRKGPRYLGDTERE